MKDFYPIKIENVKNGYFINKFGVIKNKHAKIIKPFVDRQGYLTVKLQGINGRKRLFIHRILALLFIPPVSGKNLVNHKDLNKKNNSIENLEWCTNKENVTHAIENKSFKNIKATTKSKSHIVVFLYKNGFSYFDKNKIIPMSQSYFYQIINNIPE